MNSYREITKFFPGNSSMELAINTMLEIGWKIKNVYNVTSSNVLVVFYVDNCIDLKKINIVEEVKQVAKSLNKTITKFDALSSEYCIKCNNRYDAEQLCGFVYKNIKIFWTNDKTLLSVANCRYYPGDVVKYYNIDIINNKATTDTNIMNGKLILTYNDFKNLPD